MAFIKPLAPPNLSGLTCEMELIHFASKRLEAPRAGCLAPLQPWHLCLSEHTHSSASAGKLAVRARVPVPGPDCGPRLDVHLVLPGAEVV